MIALFNCNLTPAIEIAGSTTTNNYVYLKKTLYIFHWLMIIDRKEFQRHEFVWTISICNSVQINVISSPFNTIAQ